MAFATQTSSLLPNHRLEASLNVLSVNPNGSFTVEYILGMRRDGGTGVNGSATFDIQQTILPSGGDSGTSQTIAYDLRTSSYQQLLKIGPLAVTPPAGQNQIRYSASSTDGAPGNPFGQFNLQVTVDIPPPSQATIPNFSPVSFVAGSPISITWSGAQSTFSHALRFSFGSYTNELIADGLPSSSSGYSYTPPTWLLTEIPNTPAAPYTITLETFNASGTSLGVRSFTGELRAPSTGPTVSAVGLSDANTAVSTQVGAFVQGLSVLRLDSITATAPQGATVAERRLEMGGQNIRIGETRALLVAGANPYVARAWDSRGREGSLSGSVNVLPYSGPGLSIPLLGTPTGSLVYRSNSAGVYDPDGENLAIFYVAHVASLVNGTQRNTISVRISTRPFDGETWTLRNAFTPAATVVDGRLSTAALTQVVGGGAIYSADESYLVRVEVLDRFNTLTSEETAPTAYVTVDLNGPNVGIGKLHERGTLDVAGSAFFGSVHGSESYTEDLNSAIFGGDYIFDANSASNTPSLPGGFYSLVTRRIPFGPVEGANVVMQEIYDISKNVLLYSRGGEVAANSEAVIWDSGWNSAGLPEPQGVNGPSVQAITATSWANVPNIPTISLTLPQPAWVRVDAFGWLQGTGGDVRAGVALSGATTLAANEAYGSLAWGTVMWAQGAYLQGSTSKLVRCNAGTTVFRMQGYRSGSGTHQLNYSTMVASPERWAA